MPLIDPITMSAINPSSSSQKLASSSTPLTKSSLPIDILPTDIARFFSYAHPALLLSTYYLRFPSLVADSVPTLLNTLLPLAVIQVAYAVVCLPATRPVTGTSTKPVKKAKTGVGKRDSSESGGGSVKAFTTFLSLLLTLLAIPFLATISILLGAPLTTHLPHTLLTSTHISLLTIFPLIYVHGTSSKKWREIASLYSPIDEVFGGAMGCLLGAWLGAVPIPLDWDREWQKWPVTVVTGAYIGYVVGKTLGRSVFRGKRVEFD